MTTKEILVAARAKILDPIHWTRYAASRDSAGNSLSDVSNPRATSWCAMGAVCSVSNRVSPPVMALSRFSCGMGAGRFNDSRSHREVIAMFDAAIRAEDFSE